MGIVVNKIELIKVNYPFVYRGKLYKHMIMFMWIMVVLIVTVQLHTDESQISVWEVQACFL